MKLTADRGNFLDYKTKQPLGSFNESEYLKTKTTEQAATLRAFDVFRNYSDKYSTVTDRLNIKKICFDIANSVSRKNKTPTMLQIQELMSDINFKENTPEKVQRYNELAEKLQAESDLTLLARNGATTKNLADSLKKLGKVEGLYNGRETWKKWLQPSVRREKDLIDSAYKRIAKDTGVKVADLKGLVEQFRQQENVEANNEVFRTAFDKLRQKESNVHVNEQPQINNVHAAENNKVNVILDINEQNNMVDKNVVIKQPENVIQNQNEIHNAPKIDENNRVIIDELNNQNNEKVVGDNLSENENVNQKKQEANVSGNY